MFPGSVAAHLVSPVRQTGNRHPHRDRSRLPRSPQPEQIGTIINFIAIIPKSTLFPIKVFKFVEGVGHRRGVGHKWGHAWDQPPSK